MTLVRIGLAHCDVHIGIERTQWTLRVRLDSDLAYESIAVPDVPVNDKGK